MKLLFGQVCLMLLVFLGATDPEDLDELDAYVEDVTAQPPTDPMDEVNKKLKDLNTVVGVLTRQMMLQQLAVEEKIRSDADSGVKQIRYSRDGTRPYYRNTHGGLGSVLAIHDHSNNDRTVGMGEFVAVLNGVEFRTRHNDYRLYMPHRTSKDYHAVEEIPFPDVPPAVTSKPTVNEQIKEMRAWFKAFHDQDYKVRDYRKYFRPIICYLEGAWTTSTSGAIDEGFESDRHFIDANSWHDLQEKVRFTAFSGRKDNLENFSYLPVTIMNTTKEGYPTFAQWNYRILCNPISRDLPLNRLRVVEELGPRMAGRRTYAEHSRTRSARFQINPVDSHKFTERMSPRWEILDALMYEVPGKDNYQGNLTDEAFGLPAFTVEPRKTGKVQAHKYHRRFKVMARGAMGLSTRTRGYADANLFMALTTQPKVAGMDLETCKGRGKKKVCKTVSQKWTYAIPLEIIYLTPLSKWNPYNLQFKGAYRSPWGKTVFAGGRNGGNSTDMAYNGTNSKLFYQTPVEFFSGGEIGADAADTARNAVAVLDKDGIVRMCKASGTRITFPYINDVGNIRQRYPIMPVHGEGSSVWKELEALKDLTLFSKTYGYILRQPLSSGPVTGPANRTITLEMGQSTSTKVRPHTHYITLNEEQVTYIKQGGKDYFLTSQSEGHQHEIRLRYVGSKKQYQMTWCKGDPKGTRTYRCKDKHYQWLVKKPHMN